MRSVLLHVDGAGVSWFISKCRSCGDVHKYLVADVAKGPVPCRGCGASMELRGAEMLGTVRNENGYRERVPGGDGECGHAGS